VSKAKPLRVTVRIQARDLPKLAGLDVLSIEETTPAGWTRRVPAGGKR